MAGVVAQSYSDALFSLAKEETKLDLMKEQLCFVNAQMQENKEFLQVLTHPKIHKDEKKKTLEEVFGKAIDHTLLNFLKLLIDKGRFQNLDEITKEFVKCYNVENNIEVAYIRSAKPLNDEEIARLQAMLEKKLAKKIDLRLVVDPSLIAGLRIKINDMVLDHTAYSRMERLKQLAIASDATNDAQLES